MKRSGSWLAAAAARTFTSWSFSLDGSAVILSSMPNLSLSSLYTTQSSGGGPASVMAAPYHISMVTGFLAPWAKTDPMHAMARTSVTAILMVRFMETSLNYLKKGLCRP
jgi:hypothetical protein